MKSDLIIGIVLWIVGVALLSILPKFSTKNESIGNKLRKFCSYTFPDIFLLLAYLHLAEYSLSITGEQINLKNGIFLFFAILALCHLTHCLIDFIKTKSDNRRN